MNKDDILLINKLISLALTILKVTKELATKDTNSNEYQTISKKLNNLIQLENDFYNEINSNNISDYLKYLDGTNEASILTNYELVIDGKDEYLAKKRVYNKLFYISHERTILNYQASYNNIEAKVPIDSKFYLNKSLQEDFLRIFLFKLNEYINNPKCILYKDKLIEIKHLISYLNPDLNTKDNEYNYLLLNSKSLATILNINNYYKYLNNFLQKEFIYNVKPSIISLIITNNLDYNENKEILRIIINLSLIKSYLVFKDD